MDVIIWEDQVKANCIAEFEKIYSPTGAWAEPFKKGNSFIGTELLRDETHFQRYITIDQWNSAADDQSFLTQWKEEYQALEAQCEGLTEQETLLGKWATIDSETR